MRETENLRQILGMPVWPGGQRRGGGALLQGRHEVRLRILYLLDECTVYDLFSSRGHIMSRQQSQPPPIVNNIVCSKRFKHASKSQLQSLS